MRRLKLAKAVSILTVAAMTAGIISGCSALKQDSTKIYVEEITTKDSEAEQIAEQFARLAEARLGKDEGEVEAIAEQLLTAGSKSKFMREYRSYMDSLGKSGSIIIDSYYKKAEQEYNAKREQAIADGLINEDGTHTDKLDRIARSRQGETGEQATAEEQTQTQAEQAQPQTETEQTQAETETQQATEEQEQTIETQTQTEQAQEQGVTLETEIGSYVESLDYPSTKEGLMDFVDDNVTFLAEGEDYDELENNRKQPWLILGYEGAYTNEVIPAITMADFDNATYDEMLVRAKQMIFLYRYDMESLNNYFLSQDTRTPEQRQADYEKSVADYQKFKAAALAEKERIAREADGDDEPEGVQIGVVADTLSTNFVNPETSSLIKQDNEGRHIVYWSDISPNDRAGNKLVLTILDQRVEVDLGSLYRPIQLYKEQSYSILSWRVWDAPFDEVYPRRIMQDLASNDITNFSLLIEYKLTPDNKVELTDEQIAAIFSYNGEIEK